MATVWVECEADVDLTEFRTEDLKEELLARGAGDKSFRALGEELYIAMSNGDRDRQDYVCRELVYELADRII